MSPRLVIVAGPSRGTQVALETEEVALGRDSSCGVCLPDATLSRRHALLAEEPGRVADPRPRKPQRPARQRPPDGGPPPLRRRPDRARGERPRLPARAAGGRRTETSRRRPRSSRRSASRSRRRSIAGDAAALASRKVERSLGLLLAASRRFAAERTVEGLAKALLSSARDVAGGTSGAVLVPDEGNGLREVAAPGERRAPRGSPRRPRRRRWSAGRRWPSASTASTGPRSRS